jgi:DNA-nicking Smr family endonuclease
LTNKISDKDKEDWENFISSKEKLHNKDHNKKKKNNYKIKSIDLHGYTLDEANKSIQDFINKSYEENINKLIVVTGKGLHSNNEKDPYVSKDFSILKHSVPEFIKKNIEIMKKISEIKGAKIEDGGDGAFYIYLKKKK